MPEIRFTVKKIRRITVEKTEMHRTIPEAPCNNIQHNNIAIGEKKKVR